MACAGLDRNLMIYIPHEEHERHRCLFMCEQCSVLVFSINREHPKNEVNGEVAKTAVC